MLLSAMGKGYRYFTAKDSGNRQGPWKRTEIGGQTFARQKWKDSNSVLRNTREQQALNGPENRIQRNNSQQTSSEIS